MAYTFTTNITKDEHDAFVTVHEYCNLLQSASWAKVKDADGYQIYASNNKKFKKKIVVNVSKKHTSTKITFNKKVSKIYVKIRPYKKIKGKKTFSDGLIYYFYMNRTENLCISP